MSRVLAFAILVLLVSGAAVMAANAQTTSTREPGRPSDKGHDATGDNDTARERPEPRRQAGRLAVDDGHVAGRYVEFELDLPSCTIHEYRAYNLTLFSEIRLPSTDCRLASGGPAGRMEIRGQDANIRLHDAPNALVQFHADEAVELVLANGVNTTEEEGGWEVMIGNLTGRIFSRNDTGIQLEGGTFTSVDATMMLHPPRGTSTERREIFDAIQEGKVGAETDLVMENGSIVSEILTYDDVQVGVRQNGKDRFDFTVGANLSEGRVFVTNFDPGAFSPERMRVDYADVDGSGRTKAVIIRQADSLDEVLDFDPGKGPVYFVFEDAEGWHAAVAVPEFSVHLFQVVGLPLQVVPLLLYGIVIGGLFLAAGGLGIILERRARG